MRFHLGDILSITTGTLVSPDHMDGVYRILNHLTGDNLFTHQLPAACEAMRPALVAQFPEIAAIEAPEFAGADDVPPWLAEQVKRFGEWHEVAAPSSALWGEHDPIQELVDMVGEDRVISVPATDETDPAAVASMVADVVALNKEAETDR